jgi:hypothetical protein
MPLVCNCSALPALFGVVLPFFLAILKSNLTSELLHLYNKKFPANSRAASP